MTAITTTAAPPRGARSNQIRTADYRPALVNVGTIVWLASELMFFSGLFAAYLTLRAATPSLASLRRRGGRQDGGCGDRGAARLLGVDATCRAGGTP